MTTLAAYSDLLKMGKSVLTTEDAALRLGLSRSGATRLLTRLRDAELAQRLFRGLWTLDRKIDPLTLPEHLTAPFPAYISLYSALYFHGMIGQVPQVTYVVSLGPTRTVQTSMGTYSIHRVAPDYFGGYRMAQDTGIHLATPAKALLDVLYLASARSRLFASLPELSIVRGFDKTEASGWIDRIGDPSRRTRVRKRLAVILGRRASVRP